MAFPGQLLCRCVALTSGATCALCAAHSLACSFRWLDARHTLTHNHLCATPWLTPLHCLLQVKPQEVELVRRDYVANGGWETFLSYEDPRQDILVGLLRLRQVGSPTIISAPQLIHAAAADLQSTTNIPTQLLTHSTCLQVEILCAMWRAAAELYLDQVGTMRHCCAGCHCTALSCCSAGRPHASQC